MLLSRTLLLHAVGGVVLLVAPLTCITAQERSEGMLRFGDRVRVSTIDIPRPHIGTIAETGSDSVRIRFDRLGEIQLSRGWLRTVEVSTGRASRREGFKQGFRRGAVWGVVLNGLFLSAVGTQCGFESCQPALLATGPILAGSMLLGGLWGASAPHESWIVVGSKHSELSGNRESR